MAASSEGVIVGLRPETPADEPFVRQLVIDTIAGELAAHTWPEPMRTALLDVQYRSRRARPSSGGSSLIIVADGQDAGWLVVEEFADGIRIVEIMVAPARRGGGIGSAAIALVLRRAALQRKPVSLLVNVMNAGAIRLYERLGFRAIDGDEVQRRMEWTATAAPAPRESAPPRS